MDAFQLVEQWVVISTATHSTQRFPVGLHKQMQHQPVKCTTCDKRSEQQKLLLNVPYKAGLIALTFHHSFGLHISIGHTFRHS